MKEIKLIKRYPHSRTEDIVDAYMRGWNDALDAVQNGKFHIAERNETESECNTCKYAEDADEHCELCGIADINNYEPTADRKTESNSEKPNNCEHITEDGVTCAKYPACDDCLDNPLNKVKGSERLVKGSEQTEPTISKMEQVDEPQTPYDNCQSCLHWVYDGYWYCECNECRYEPKDEPMKTTDYCDICKRDMCKDCIADATNPYCVPSHYEINYEPKDEPQTERSE